MKVYLDMDGVLVDFRAAICRAFDKPTNSADDLPKWTFWEDWDGVTFEDVDAKCTISFWAYLAWAYNGPEILDTVLHKFDTNDVYLLTTPMPNPSSWTGKALWVQDNIPAFTKRLIVTQASKSTFATPDTLLIDDKDENIEEFIAAGGQGILVPRSWNKLHGWADESLQVVKNSLEVF